MRLKIFFALNWKKKKKTCSCICIMSRKHWQNFENFFRNNFQQIWKNLERTLTKLDVVLWEILLKKFEGNTFFNHKCIEKLTMEKLEERFGRVEQRPPTVINQTSDGTRHAAVMVGKQSSSKIPIVDGTGPWRKLYHKQFEAAVAHNQRCDAEKAVASTQHQKEQAQQVLAALP